MKEGLMYLKKVAKMGRNVLLALVFVTAGIVVTLSMIVAFVAFCLASGVALLVGEDKESILKSFRRIEAFVKSESEVKQKQNAVIFVVSTQDKVTLLDLYGAATPIDTLSPESQQKVDKVVIESVKTEASNNVFTLRKKN